MRISDWSSDVCSSDLVVGEAHDLALLFGNQLVAPGEAQKQFGAALVREAGKDSAGERDLAVAQPKFAAGGQAVDAPALLRDQRRVQDRKSTRLTSSH